MKLLIMDSRWVWLMTWEVMKVAGVKFYVSILCDSPEVRECLNSFGNVARTDVQSWTGNITAIARVEPREVYSFMSPLRDRGLREQVEFWQRTLGSDLEGELAIFGVL